MNRLALSAATLAIAMIMGCSSPSDTSTEQSTDSTESALAVRCDIDDDVDSNCDGPGPKAYTLTSVDGTLVSGVNGFGQTISVTLTTATKFKLANLKRHYPGDPSFFMPLLQAYNAAIENHGNVIEAVDGLQSLRARIGVKPGATTAFSFRPVP